MRTLALLLPLMLLAACSDASGPGSRSLAVAATVIAAAGPSQPNVAVAVRNRGSQPVRVFTCGEHLRVAVERREPRGWEAYSGGHCIMSVGTGPVELAPGAAAETVVYVPDAGVYRAELEVSYTDRPGSTRRVVSEPFTIR